MGLAKYAMLFFALLFVTAMLGYILPVMMKDKPTDSFYADANLTINQSTGMVESVVKTGGNYSSAALLVAAILFIGAALVFMASRRKR